jgi:DNA-directed RNA polymerase subunit RPC12/RpoP
MVTRYYVCDACEHEFVLEQPMMEDLKKVCPKCKKQALYQDLTGQHVFVYQECKTLGHQAQRNTERMGKYELESKRKQDKEAKEKPRLDHMKKHGVVPANATEIPKNKSWYNTTGENLTEKLKPVLEDPKKTQKYIEEGK